MQPLEDELEAAFQKAVDFGPAALVVSADAFFNSRSQQIAALALSRGLSAISLLAPVRCRGRPDELGRYRERGYSFRWRLCRPDSSRRATPRIAGPAGDQSRAGHQPQDC